MSYPNHLANLLCTLCLFVATSAAAAPPNVLLIIADDFRDFGGTFTPTTVKTPHLDRLAKRGMRFERAYAQYPVCNPSRISLLTGMRCEETGVVQNTTFFRSRMPEVVTLPELLRTKGWFTGSYGKIFHVGEVAGELRSGWTDEGRSWDEAKMFQPTPLGRQGEIRALAPGRLPWCQVGVMDGSDDDQPDGQNASATIAAIEKHSAEGRPWMIGAGFHKPHDPFFAPRKYFDLYQADQLQLYRDPASTTPAPQTAIPGEWAKIFAEFSDQDRRDYLHAYLAGVSFMDAQVGKLLDTLDRLQLWENTVVIFIGDHGYHLGERGWWNKNTLFDRSCRAPLIMVAPGMPGGVRYASPVEFIDIYPTLTELCGLAPPHPVAGKSLVPVLRDVSQTHKEAAYTLVMRGAQHYGQTVVTDRWRFTQWTDGSRELYDHQSDPEETQNLANDPQHQDQLQKLSKQLQQLPPLARR